YRAAPTFLFAWCIVLWLGSPLWGCPVASSAFAERGVRMRRVLLPVLACLPLAAVMAAPSDPTPMNLAAPGKALTDKKKEVRLAAVQQLGSWGNGASLAAPDLARLVQEDPEEAVANSAAVALAQIGPFGAKELIKLVKSPTFAVRQRALVALSKMGP